MEDSILKSIKKPLGLGPDYTPFDEDVILHINSAFSMLMSAGCTPPQGIMITGDEEKWSDYLTDPEQTNMIKSYVFVKVKMLFDPPKTSFVIDAQNKIAEEIIVRLHMLELVFNPTAYDAILYPDVKWMWNLTGGQDFPYSSQVGDLGYDENTGDVWRRVA